MERESFEDEQVSKLMNEHYVAIKVDREERPDVDQIYMTVCQAMTGQGGWPLTIVMTPDQKPFFAGTYFPKETRFGRMGLMEVLHEIAGKWAADRSRIEASGEEIAFHIKQGLAQTDSGQADPRLIEQAAANFSEQFDGEYGGFGAAPKFPTPHNLMFLLRYSRQTKSEQALGMVEKTLDSMARGGIYDHVGFGFARYSTDRKWLIPHFEKMLYDNALLAMAYTEAYQSTRKESYKRIVEDVLSYVLRDMTDPDGGFYCAEDADSEGVEGKFYVWTQDEVKQVLGEADGDLYCRCYHVSEFGNFEGFNIPNLIEQNTAEFAMDAGLDPKVWEEKVRELNAKLFQHREHRVHPHKDDKVLTAWNGLMIASLAIAGRAFQRDRYIDAAKRAVRFINERLTREDGRLMARYRQGEAAHLGYVDDYAFLIWGLIELYEATFLPRYLARAIELQEQMMDLFWDAKSGGFFFYGNDGENLIARPKEIYDGAMPSGNSVAALNLLRLARLTGQVDFEENAMRLISAFAGQVEKYPAGYSFFLMALQFAFRATRELVISGSPLWDSTRSLIARIQERYLPDAVVIFHPEASEPPEAPEAPTDESEPAPHFSGTEALSTEDSSKIEQLSRFEELSQIDAFSIEELAGFTRGQVSVKGKATLYICENFACKLPITDLKEALAQLEAGPGK